MLRVKACAQWATLYKTLQQLHIEAEDVVIAFLYKIRSSRRPVGSFDPSVVVSELLDFNGKTWYRVWPPQVAVVYEGEPGDVSEGGDSIAPAIEDTPVCLWLIHQIESTNTQPNHNAS
jgi:hypothetical protein